MSSPNFTPTHSSTTVMAIAKRLLQRYLLLNFPKNSFDSILCRILYVQRFFQNDIRCSGFALHIFSSLASTLLEPFFVIHESGHGRVKRVVVGNLHCTSRCKQLLSLLESLVVRTEEHWYIPYRRLQNIMYSHSESTSYVSHLAIVIDARQ